MAGHPQRLVLDRNTAIPLAEVRVEFAHASGPGGQNVNKVSSQATACFAVDESPSLTANQKRRIHAALGNRINKEGVLRVGCEETRSQARNRALAIERLRTLLARALRPRKKRRPTRRTRAANEKRLRRKRERSARKQQRRKPGSWE